MNDKGYKISITRLPLPNFSLAEEPQPEPAKQYPPQYKQTEAEALTLCREWVQADYTVEVLTPQNVLWEHAEIIRRLNNPREPYTT